MWDFGDGSSNSNLSDPSHTYSTSGTYNVSLYLFDCNGNVCDTSMQMITVNCSGSSIDYFSDQ